MLPTRNTGGTSSPTAAHVRSWEDSDSDVAELDFVAVVLKADIAFACFTVVRHRRELALRDAVFPFGAAELVLEELVSVEPVLDVISIHYNARGIPLPRWIGS